MVTLKQYIAEADAKSLIVVDIQPAYYPVSHKVLRGGGYLSRTYVHAADNIIDFINTRADRVLAYFNGSDAGYEDTIKDVQDHYLEMGLNPHKLDAINFQEKTYAYLRGWMDEGIDVASIIKTVRYMVMNRIQQSDQIKNSAMVELLGDVAGEVDDIDPIYIPDIDLSLLQQFSNAYISGGARHECLKEITIMMNAFNIKYTLVKDFIY